MAALSPNDPCSFSRPDVCQLTHLHLDLDVDFVEKVLRGKVVLSAKKKSADARLLVLDTRDLKIVRVTDESSGADIVFTLHDAVQAFGSKLEISLPAASSTEVKIVIEYETSPQSTALQWLSAQQTAGKRHEFLFSQCQAIHARSLVPCQDSPAVKMPYSAKISAPSQLVALMSAVRQEQVANGNKRSHTFSQEVPIPSYLIALVVGDLDSRRIGPRSLVWAEKETVEAAAFEFSETEAMLAEAEGLLGPYVWGVYDLLVLPPSFPYGGMENPCLTFVTPTLLAGDRSLATVVAHEITHSWTGNLVTNSSPEHFWLNEGHTMFVERKIASRMRGENFRHFDAIGGWKDLSYTVKDVLGVEHPFTVLVPCLNGVDPDDAFSTVPYEKGHSLLMYLEQLLGGPEIFEPFLRAYIDEFKYKSIDTNEWKTFLYKFFKNQSKVLDTVDWNAWFNLPGMPPVKPNFDHSLADACQSLASLWSSASDDLSAFCADDIANMSSFQLREFLSILLDGSVLPEKKIIRMDEVYQLSVMQNSEIKFRWLRLCLKSHMQPAIQAALDFVNQQGRMKFVRPLYRDMCEWSVARPKAVSNYKANETSMHPLTASMIAKDISAFD
ncbi:hypothetical protein CAPTEDRAFT_162472 [Capitella teleta]|uniref:Leukotriene A(4) hydrolase n=1 Tax=Capitella teleta TaxID=283909 RepID=R7T9S7_CAPTE|nr:hypothetical protein CAPTEDRAFT_162472 [Capitella teleta]|eukprot:ELT87749.1 hypothetical protein CAPTEDRAFT_162472 [Capitella teleta]